MMISRYEISPKQEGSSRRAKNLSGDIKDSEIYTDLIHQIAPKVPKERY